MVRVWTLPALMLTLALPSSVALAHGQFPLPLGTLVDGQGQDPLVVATFGVLTPLPDRAGYQWVCEEVAGGSFTTPVTWARTATGTLLGGARSGLVRFTPNLCGYTRPTGAVAVETVRSLAVHPAGALVAAAVGNASVHISADDGRTFAATALGVDGGIPTALLLEGDVTDPFVLAHYRHFSDGHTEFVRARPDGGALVTVGSAEESSRLWKLLARDNSRANAVYVREDGEPVDRLLRVSLVDGSIMEVLAAGVEGDELTLGVSADGQRVAYGGLLMPLHVSSNAGATFEARSSLNDVRGITWGTGGSLYVAADNWVDGFAVGHSDDLGVTFTSLGRFVDIVGVRVCPDAGPGCPQAADACAMGVGNDTEAVCTPYWLALQTLFGIGQDAGTNLPGGADGGGDQNPSQGCTGCGQAGAPSALMVLLAVWMRGAWPQRRRP